MKSGTVSLLVMAWAAITPLVAGCSPTGWAVREVLDGSNLQPGQNVTITRTDGGTVSGEYVGTATLAAEEYLDQYRRAVESASQGGGLPAIGQTVHFTTSLSEKRCWTGQLVGFDLENMWLRFPGAADPEPIYFSSISSLSDKNGGTLQRMILRGMFLNGEIPLMSALKFRTGDGEVSVPLSSIREMRILQDEIRPVSIGGDALRHTYWQ